MSVATVTITALRTRLRCEALRRIDFPDFLAFLFRARQDLTALARLLREIEVTVRTKRGIRDGTHRDRFGDCRGNSSHDQHVIRPAGGDDAQRDTQHVDET